MTSRPLFRLLSLAFAASAAVAVAGCGGKSNDSRPAPSRPAANAPAYNATAETVGDYLAGDWNVMLLPEVGQANVDAPSVDASLTVGAFNDNSARLAGSFAGSDVTDGEVRVTDGGAESPMVMFTTDSMTVPGLSGEDMQVDGPINWEGKLYEGRLYGTATGPDGRTSRWEAMPR